MLHQKYENKKVKDRKYLASNYYLIAIFTKKHQNSFGKLLAGRVFLNDRGKLVQKSLMMKYIEKYSVMPNCFSAIVRVDIKLVKQREEQDIILKDVVKEIKTRLTKEVYKNSKANKAELWQRSYYAKFIQDDRAYQRAERAIENSSFMVEAIN